jgi:opacity protein-like surface antigen
MKRSFVVLLGVVLASGVFAASAQVVPSAYRSGASYWAGGEFSVFQPDYTGQGYATRSGPNLYGIGVYIDADFTRWVQIEAQGRWLHWNQVQQPGASGANSQNTYMIGPRVPIHEFHRFTPYGKFLIGWGSGDFLNGRTTAWAYGGGVDYHLGRKLNVRGDFEYQDWRVANPNLQPYGYSIGANYRFW